MTDPELLRGVDIFNGLTDQQLRQVASICQELELRQGDVVLQEHAQGSEMYVIAHGEVEVMLDVGASNCPLPVEDGQVSIISLGAGQVFGEMALVDQGSRSATVRCVVTPTRVLTVPHRSFIELCEKDARLGYVVMRNIAADVCFKLRARNMTWG